MQNVVARLQCQCYHCFTVEVMLVMPLPNSMHSSALYHSVTNKCDVIAVQHIQHPTPCRRDNMKDTGIHCCVFEEQTD